MIIKRETETILMTVQNKDIKTNYVNTRKEKTQQNWRCRLCNDIDETTNYIIRECSKLAQKEYKTRHDWVGKVIHRELCKKLKVDHSKKWNMHNLESILENEMHKLL